MTDGGWLDMSAYPDREPEAVAAPEVLQELRRLITEAPVPEIDDETWAGLVNSAVTAPGTAATPEPAPREPASGAIGRSAVYEELREETLALFPPLRGAASAAGAAETVGRLDAAASRLAAGEFTVVICGEFKRGKSTLLNALLQETGDLLPVDTVIATRLVTTVAYAAEERITVVLEGDDGGEPERREIDRSQVASYATESGNPENTKRALLLEILTPNPVLESGVRWVDTPGVGGVYESHTAITMGFLPQADALVFVADITKPLTESELTFLSSATTAAQVVDDTDGQLFVLTKIDLVGDYRTEAQDMTGKIARVTGRPADAVTVVPVSAQAELDFLTSGDPADRELSNFEQFTATLWAALHRRRATLLLGGALADLDAAARALLAPIDTEIDALGRDTKAGVEQLREQIGQKQQRLRALPKDHARWRADLAQSVGTLTTELRREAAAGLDRVWHRFSTEYLYQDTFLSDPDRLLGQLSADAAVVVGAVNELADRKAAALLAEFAARSDLELGTPRFVGLPAPPVPTIAVTGRLGEADRPDHQLQRVRATTFTAGAGAAVAGTAGGGIGALIGSLLFPGPGTALGFWLGSTVGTALGGVVGGRIGWDQATEDAKKRDREARRRSIKTELGTLHGEQKRHVDEALAQLRTELSAALTAELESRIAQEQESIDNAVQRLQRKEGETEQDAQRRLGELHAERAPLEQVRVALGRLAGRVAVLGQPAGAAAGPAPAGER